MTGKDFLTLAKNLYSSDEEAARRTSVSRAYYALYHLIRECLILSGIRVTTKFEEHERMIRYLKNAGMQEAKYIGEKMDDIRKKRNNADYELNDTSFNESTCALYCGMVESLFNELDTMDKYSLRNGLIQYAKSINEPFST